MLRDEDNPRPRSRMNIDYILKLMNNNMRFCQARLDVAHLVATGLGNRINGSTYAHMCICYHILRR